MLTVSIVTTAKAPLDAIFRHVDYHLQIGVCRCYLFLDDSDPASSAPIKERYADRVVVHECTASYWMDTHHLPRPDSVEERQRLNADYALSLARHNGDNWIAHIDIDEFIYVSSGALPNELNAMPGKNVVRMDVLEAIPPALETADLFDITDFKALPFDVSFKDSSYSASCRLRRCCQAAFYRVLFAVGKRLGLSSMRHGFHYFYNAHVIGKCITRVTDDVESLRLHFPRLKPGAMIKIDASARCMLMHFESCTISEWIGKWQRRRSKEGFAAALDPRQSAIFAQFEVHATEQKGLEGLYRSLYLYAEAELKALRLFGLVKKIDLQRFFRQRAVSRPN